MKKSRRLIFFLLCACCAATLSCRGPLFNDILTPEERQWLVRKNNTLLLAPPPDYPPLDFFTEDGQYTGISSDYIRLLEKKLGTHIQVIRYNSWSDILKAAQDNSIDLISSAVPGAFTETGYTFSRSYFEYPAVILTRQSIRKNLTLETLPGLRVGIVEGYALSEYLSKAAPAIDPKVVETNLEGILMVSDGSLDALITDLKVASYYIETEKIKNLRVAGELDFLYSLSFACVGEDNAILHSIIEKGLSRITPKEKTSIEHRWIELSTPSSFWRDISAAAVFIGFGLAGALFIFFLIRPDRTIKEKEKRSYKIDKSPPLVLLRNFLKYYWPVYTIILMALSLTTAIYFSAKLEESRLTAVEKQWLDARKDSLVLAPDPNWPPFEYFDETGKYRGLVADYAALIEERLGIKFVIAQYDSRKTLLDDLESGKIDVLGGSQKTQAGSEQLFYTKPFYEIPNVIIVRKSFTGELTLESLAQKRVTLGAGHGAEEVIKENFPTIILIPAPDLQTGLRMVSFDEVDAMIIDIASALFFIEREGITNLRIAGNTGISSELSIATIKDKPILHSAIEKALASIKEKERSAIHKKWIRADQTGFVFNTRILISAIAIIIFIVLAIILILLWNRLLRNQVHQHTLALKEELEKRTLAEQELQILNLELERRVSDRTRALKEALEKQKEIQSQLVQTEKLAALGELVAGIAHEINTPVGVAITASSHLITKTEKLKNQYHKEKISKEDLERYLDTTDRSSSMILNNLQRAGELIQSFKRVAVDQTSGERRLFNIKEYLKEIFLSLNPKLRKTNYHVHIDCPESIEIDSFPGAFSQIITNLVMNSLIHGFEGRETGNIVVTVTEEENQLFLDYSDNGNGIEQEVITKIFDPFFTTKRGKGGSGLGLHIVFNQVTQILGGTIHCESIPGEGTRFIITCPIKNL